MPEIDISDKLGYTLLKKGIIDYETLELAIKKKEAEDPKTRRTLAQILVSDFYVEHDLVFKEVANLYGFREIYISDEVVDTGRIDFIKKLVESGDGLREEIINAKMLPLKFDEARSDKLVVVAADPTNKQIPRLARSFMAKRYEVAYVRLKDLQGLIDKVFPPENEFLKVLASTTRDELGEIGGTGEEEGLDEQQLEAEINKSVLINLVEGMLVEAVRKGASDVHVVPRDGGKTDIHFRIDGDLRLWYTQEGVLPEAISAVIKDRSKGADRFEREAGQDAFMQRKVDDHWIRFRVSILPMVASEFKHKFETIVIRILDDRKVITDLEKLGLQGPAREGFFKAIKKPQGMVILTGPTGSGKSTTLVAALHQVIDPTVNVLTVEDPVEYIINGARQLRIGPKMNFEQAIRSILRHDPDIVLVGEIRDRETAEIAVKLANTGHLTFSTLHTNDAPSAVARLYKMGIEPFLLSSAVNIIVAQRLVRTLCNNCKKPLTEEEFDKEAYLRFGFKEEELREHTLYKAVGCDKCNNTGYKGRAAIHEALYFTKEIKHIILNAGENINEDDIREQALKDGMWTLRRAGINRILEGVSTMEEVAATTTEE
ncbi:MAG: Flp pilus assembly complex ATPase component TadA [Bacteroidetes bacterium]|nr:Flp pilus assembly complex ATPase component TadA [Bacteroidota bacterium]